MLGGGGSTGNAWLIGVVAGLADAGLDVSTTADLTVGTSAGSTTAAQLAPTVPGCPAPPDWRAVYSAEVGGRVLYVVINDGPDALVIDAQSCAEVLRITPQ